MLTFFAPLLVYILWYPVMLLTLFRVEIGILFFISLVPIIAVMKKLATFPGGHNFADYLLIAIVIGWITNAVRENRKIFISSPINGVVILMVIGSLINLIRGYTFMSFSEEINLVRLSTWKNYMLLPIIYFVAANNLKTEKIVKLVIACISFGLIASTFYFHNTFKWLKGFHYSDAERISGVFTSLGPNEMGIFFAMYAFLHLGISYFIENKVFKFFLLVTCAVCFYPILYSYSRSAYSAVLIGFVTLGLLKDRRLLIIPIMLVLFYSYILPNSVVERIDMTFVDTNEVSEKELERSGVDVGGTTISVTGRKLAWDRAIEYFKEHPFLGIGFDTFRHEFGWITHSLYYKILAEQGLLGLIINISFYMVILRQSYKLFKNSQLGFGRGIGLGFLASMAVFFIGAIGGDVSEYYNLMAISYVFLGVVANFNFQYPGVNKNP
jgi:O-antigen ligase